MSSSEDVSFTLQLTVDNAVTELRRVQTLAFQTLSLFRRMGLPDEMDAAISKLMQVISVINQALLAFQASRMAAGDPIAWATAGVAVTATAWSAYEMAEYELRG